MSFRHWLVEPIDEEQMDLAHGRRLHLCCFKTTKVSNVHKKLPFKNALSKLCSQLSVDSKVGPQFKCDEFPKDSSNLIISPCQKKNVFDYEKPLFYKYKRQKIRNKILNFALLNKESFIFAIHSSSIDLFLPLSILRKELQIGYSS